MDISIRLSSLAFPAYAVLLLLGTVLPINPSGSALNENYFLQIRWDYLLHGAVYFPLPLLLSQGARRLTAAVFLSLAIAAVFELLQLPLSYRTFNINDLAANCLGILAGVPIAALLRRRENQQK
ncbi:MAG: VanZ family protein [Spirochaetaceae bacterium]|nr:VanZ family protein [Spirochaetaceae bacterium]MCF7947174.1 VanZ family protein [Spirochaetia bacterium]MCF7950039.1 VanZ family protein [Spirochaetaceae bacterium]